MGIPYDGKSKTAQLAPAISLTLSALGQPVLLHGAQDIPTKSGVTVGAVLHELGLPMTLTVSEASALLDRTGISYVDAKAYLPQWDALTELRHNFGLRTVLNTVEKLFNPANAPYQISGFFHANYINRLRSMQTGSALSYVLQGEEGSIEVAVGKRTPVFAIEKSADLTIDPSTIGLVGKRVRLELSPVLADHVALNQAVINGEIGDALTQVALSTGVILHLLGKVNSLATGFTSAKEALLSGTVAQKLAEVVA